MLNKFQLKNNNNCLKRQLFFFYFYFNLKKHILKNPLFLTTTTKINLKTPSYQSEPPYTTTLSIADSSLKNMHQPSNTKLKYDRIKLKSRQQHRQHIQNSPANNNNQQNNRHNHHHHTLSNQPVVEQQHYRFSSSEHKLGCDDNNTDDYDYDVNDDDEYDNNTRFSNTLENVENECRRSSRSRTVMSPNQIIKNAKSLGYLTGGGGGCGGSGNVKPDGGGTNMQNCGGREDDYLSKMRRSLSNYTYVSSMNGSRHSLKPLSISNNSLNTNWYKPKSLQLPTSSSNLDADCNGNVNNNTNINKNHNNNKTGILVICFVLIICKAVS